MVEAIENAGGRVTCFSTSNNLKLMQQYTGVMDYCKTNEIDLIHCHFPWAGSLGILVFAKIKIPVVLYRT